MGTRNLTCVISDGTMKVAQYGQWDGYPSGNGADLLNFCIMMTHHNQIETFKKKVDACEFVSDEKVQEFWAECGADPESIGVSMDISDKFKKKYPQLHRSTGGNVVNLIMKSSKPLQLNDDFEFGYSGLFCEWAYVIDLDNKSLGCYEGFSTEPSVTGLWLSAADKHDKKQFEGGEIYHPVKLVKTYSFNDLPTEKQFLADLEPDEEE